MHRSWIGAVWVWGALVALSGCGSEVVVFKEPVTVETTFDTLCEQHCACLACDATEQVTCLERGADLDDDARETDCTDVLAAYVACAELEYRCQPDEGAKATCEAELTAYYDCRSASASRR
jgi:hypothetical protein